MLEEKRKQLYELYKVYEAEFKSTCPELRSEGYSSPYYMHIPDNWFEQKHRIMIVGEEGAGVGKQYDEPIEQAQRFNEEYLISQIEKGVYDRNNSPFWHRVRKIAELPSVSVAWTNIDKVHVCRRGNGKLKVKEREALHKIPIKVLQGEIEILEPTHVVFFGWYGISLQSECPQVFEKLYPGGLKDYSIWKPKKMAALFLDGIHYIFTYHPGWLSKGKDYEGRVMSLIQNSFDSQSE